MKNSIITIGLLCMTMVSAQVSLSLDEAVTYALEHNKQLKAARYEKDKSQNSYKSTRAGWMPQVDATVDYMNYFGYEAEFSFAGATPSFLPEDYTAAELVAGAAAAKALGGSGAFDVSQYAGGQAYGRYLESTLPPTTIDMGGSSTAKVQVGQVLFSGQLLSGIRAAKIGMQLAEKSIEQSELEVRAGVASVYYSVLTLEKTLATIDSSLLEMSTIVAKTSVLVSTGVMEGTELDQLQVQYATLKNTQLSMARNLQITENLLRFHLGMAVNAPIVLTDKLEMIMAAITEESTLAAQFDVHNNLNYQLVEKQLEISEEMVAMEKMAYAPTLSAFYAYNAKLLTSGFDMTPNNVAGATLSIPIFSSGKRKYSVDKSKIELLQAETNQEILKDNLLMQESQLRFDYMSKLEQYKNQKENVAVARRVFESYERKFSQGVVSSMALTQANTGYLEAESAHLTSMLSLLQARVAFLKLLNTL